MFPNMQQQTTVVNSAAQASVADRMSFVRKVYGLLAVSLLTALGGAAFGKTIDPSYAFPLIIAEIGLIIFALAVRRKPGLNLIALFSFTTVSGMALGIVVSMYQAASVQQALTLTAVIFVALTAYVFVTKKDFSFLSGFLFTGLILIFVGSLLNMFFFQSALGEFVISAAGAMLFSGYILYDTSNILHRHSTDEYVSATLALYLDLINLFMFLLRLLGNRE